MRGVIALLLAISAFTTVADHSAAADELTSSTIQGNAWDLPIFDDDDGIVYAWNEFEGGLALPFLVYNGTDEPIVNGRVSATVYDDDPSNPSAVATDRWIFPLVIEPGEFGFGELDEFGFSYSEGQNVDFELSNNNDPGEYVDLEVLRGVELDRFDNLTGRIRNPTDSVVSDIELRTVCFESSGEVTTYMVNFPDRSRLDPGDRFSFEVDVLDCDGGPFFTTAIGKEH